jgi:SAM-dependent methyltransferase
MNRNSTRSSYDRLAVEYARRMLTELDHKPLDRQLLDRFAGQVSGLVCDLGCGPGQVARYLHDRGVDAFGIDLSAAMVETAAAAHPDIRFRQGDMRALPLAESSLAGVTAFYSLIHIPRAEVVDVLKEVHRVLQPTAPLLLAFHRGGEVRHFEELWGQSVQLDFIFFEREEMQGYLLEAGFNVAEIIERPPYPDVEAPTERVYMVAHK